MIVRWHREAARELDEILDYIADDDRFAAAAVARRVLMAEDHLREFPEMGRPNADFDTREYIVRRSRIMLIYQVSGDTIWVLSAWHMSRNPTEKPRGKPPSD